MPTPIQLPYPDDSISFFEAFKIASEAYWQTADLQPDTYGFQIQPKSRWNQGLTKEEIEAFEQVLGLSFPTPLKNYYRVMNGLSLPAVNIYGNSGSPPAYHNSLYHYPEDIALVQEKINWIYKANNTTVQQLLDQGASRIFPIYGHRFLLTDHPTTMILSMYGDDIIPWTTSIGELLAKDLLRHYRFPIAFEEEAAGYLAPRFW